MGGGEQLLGAGAAVRGLGAGGPAHEQLAELIAAAGAHYSRALEQVTFPGHISAARGSHAQTPQIQCRNRSGNPTIVLDAHRGASGDELRTSLAEAPPEEREVHDVNLTARVQIGAGHGW